MSGIRQDEDMMRVGRNLFSEAPQRQDTKFKLLGSATAGVVPLAVTAFLPEVRNWYRQLFIKLLLRASTSQVPFQHSKFDVTARASNIVILGPLVSSWWPSPQSIVTWLSFV